MRPSGRFRRAPFALRAALALSALCLAASAARAAQLPLRAYTTADGLPHDRVFSILQDSIGYLWIGTADGLARFDGIGFTLYGAADGLTHPTISSILEDPSGGYWIGTGGGLCRYAPDDQPRFSCTPVGGTVQSDAVTSLLLDRAGRLWIGTADGLYLARQEGGFFRFRRVELPLPAPPGPFMIVHALATDPSGALWIGTSYGLARLGPDGRSDRWPVRPSMPRSDPVLSLLVDRTNSLWIGADRLRAYDLSGDPGAVPRAAVDLGPDDGLQGDSVRAILEPADGPLLIATDVALCRLEGRRFRCDGPGSGLAEPGANVLAEDRHGNLWIGTGWSGLLRLAHDGMTAFSAADGLAGERTSAILQDREGRLVVSADSNRLLHVLAGDRFEPIVPNLPPAASPPGWGWNQVLLQDREGDWWLSTAKGVVRFASTADPRDLRSAAPRAIYTERDGLTGDEVFRLYEDGRGDVWIGTITLGHDVLNRWERTTGTIHRYELAETFAKSAPTAFQEDRAGNLWIGFYVGGLVRYREGRFDYFAPGEAAPPGFVWDMLLDSTGRLWVATSLGGVVRIDDPGSERPRFDVYTTDDGLASNRIHCIAEDRMGRIYLGTGRGVDRLDPATGRIRRFTSADGLPNNLVEVAYADREGDLWFGTRAGVSRLSPGLDRDEPAPSVLIGDLSIGGRSVPIPDLGGAHVGEIALGSGSHAVAIGFVSPWFAPGDTMRYQFRLEPSEGAWSVPSSQRTVRYANLAPGRYRFEVRAVTAGGGVSLSPASVTFSIAAPIWRRGWFFAAIVLIIAGLAYAGHRYRLARAVEVERIRTRIATDLHDDIGSSLSRISILSEVARRQMANGPPETGALLSRIGETARDLADATSDIVWSIDPREDDLGSLVARLRHFASDLLDGAGIRFSLHAPEASQGRRLPAETRRHLFLILKEALNNIARHSGARSASIAIRIDDHWIRAEVVDDGRGFDPDRSHLGNGLRNMRSRAGTSGGSLAVESAPRQGTRLSLSLPVR